MKNGNKGFTLVEAIVAIALIGIIAVGIIPAFAAQLKMTINSRNITTTVFEAQGGMEDDINSFKEILKEDGLFSGEPPVSFSIFGRNVPLYQLSKDFPLNNNKSFIVFLSEKLAEMEYRDPLVASLVRIDGENDDGTKIEGIEVASIRSSSDLKLVRGTFAIEDYTSSQDLNLYRWYRSEEGFADPVFPDNYELVEQWRNKKSLTKDELKQYAANRYLMLSLVPVDKSGVRGDEKPSINRVYIQGEEWRSGIFAWVDKNADASYDADNDVEVKYAASKSDWALLRGFSTQSPFPDPADPDKMLDPSDGSLYVPMGVERSQISDRSGMIEVSEPGEIIDWSVDKNIHFANEISVQNNSDIRMNTIEGSITVYQYAEINPINGEAQYGANGKVLLDHDGARLISDKNIILEAGDNWGSISLEPYTSLEAAENIELTAAEYVVMKGCNLDAGGNISIESKKKDVTIEDTQISAGQLILNSSSTIIGGGWDSGTSVKVSDGKVLTVETGVSPVDNAGSFNLGNTGGIAFNNGMAEDLKNPLILSLTKESSKAVSISTNYGRNTGYAGKSSGEEIGSPGTYQNLGTGETNLKYTVSKRSGSGDPHLSYSFDGGVISIDASGTADEDYTNYYELKVSDKYAAEAAGSIVFRVSALKDNSPDVEIIGQTAPSYTVTFDCNGGTPAVPDSLAVEAGMPAGTLPQPPSLAGYYFAGWNTEQNGSGSAFNEASIVAGDITVYAQYSSVPVYTVTFDKNGGTTEANPKTIHIVSGDSIGTLPAPPTRPGYRFLNWSTQADGGSPVDELTVIQSDMTVYAQWAVN